MTTTPVVLHRRLTTLSAALFGLSYICPTVVISTFGLLANTTHGATASAYVVATLAVLLTAVSYGRMAARYPEAGSAYTYVARTTNTAAGFVTGWVLILDYLFIPMVICLFTAKAFEVVLPGISFRVWVLVVAVVTSVVNILGIQIADRVNLAIMTAQLLVMAVFAGLCVAFLHSPAQATGVWTLAPFVNPATGATAIAAGAAIAAYSFLGFDAVTTLSEETHNPTTSIPRATVLAAVAGGVIFLVISYLMSLVHPGSSFKDLDNAGFEVIAAAGGPTFLRIFTIVLIVAFIAAVMCAQAGSSRLLYVMGRDGVMPLKRFAYLHPRWRTPAFNIVLMGVVMLGGEFVDVDTAASCVNFGAFIAFLAVNVCVLVDHFGTRRSLPGGGWKVLQSAAGALASLWLLVSLQRTALTVGGVWLAVGLVYLGYRTRGFRRAWIRISDRPAGDSPAGNSPAGNGRSRGGHESLGQ